MATNQSHDNKAHIRDSLDLTDAVWVQMEPPGVTIPDAAAYAKVLHTDGETYVALRSANDPDGVVLLFDMAEWAAFIKGVKSGEFDL